MSVPIRQLEDEIAVIDAGLEKLPPYSPRRGLPSAQRHSPYFRISCRRAKQYSRYRSSMNAHMTEVRSRALTNACTATRSLDLPLAVGDPRVFPSQSITLSIG